MMCVQETQVFYLWQDAPHVAMQHEQAEAQQARRTERQEETVQSEEPCKENKLTLC